MMTKREKRNLAQRKWKAKNRQKHINQCKQWRLDNKERQSHTHKEYYIANKDNIKDKVLEYAKSNPEKINARNAKRRASRLNATPEWSESEKIKVVYEKAKWLESLTGLKYHVDHIIPLQGENVCGLHIWENLQILEASVNMSKGNR